MDPYTLLGRVVLTTPLPVLTSCTGAVFCISFVCSSFLGFRSLVLPLRSPLRYTSYSFIVKNSQY